MLISSLAFTFFLFFPLTQVFSVPFIWGLVLQTHFVCGVAPLESSRDRRLPGGGEFLCVEPSPVSCSLHTLRQQHSLAKTRVNTDTKLIIILKSFFLGTIC